MTKQLSTSGLTRRRVIITAGAFGTLSALTGTAVAMKTSLQPVHWTGAALGAEASIHLFHEDPEWAKQQLVRCQQEINRLENLFSLYQPNSAICRLNAQGYLDNPDIEFLKLLSLATSFSLQTKGLFDVTMQPLWMLYAAHFSSEKADPSGPNLSVIKAVLENIGSSQIEMTMNRIEFARSGMAITLNGVAQGYITDRVAALLKSAGFANVLVSLGENYALGATADGKPWRIGIVSPKDGKTIAATVDLTNKALATSGGYGSPFSSRSDANHLLNPLTGEWAKFERSVSVISSSATHADMASTALSLMTVDEGLKFTSSQPLIEDVIYG
ncbi:MAG: thiamine biosynthesis protein ApbE [Sneathiella sp.]|nr:MAG: thiamine biosynthesis protein ApbE [Sneathiella sp.]